MKKIGKLVFFLFLFVVFSAYGAENAKVTVTASPNPLPENESVQLRIEIKVNGTAQVYRPEFDADDFTPVGSGLSGGTSSVLVNGEIQIEKRVIYTFVLFPKKSGLLKISNIFVRAGADTLRSEDMNIKVLENSAANSANQGGVAAQKNPQEEEEENPAAPNNFQNNTGLKNTPSSQNSTSGSHPRTFNSDFTVHADISRSSVYVGEPIVVDYYVYDRGGVRQMDVKKWPTFTGFWNEDLQIVQHYQFENIYIKNERMRRAFLGRYALYPIKPGKIALDKLVINARYISRNFFNSDDDTDPLNIFMGGYGPLRTGTHASQDITIEALPLPAAGRPDNFGGAVGQFTMKLEADKNSVPAHTPINITLSVEGKGNFQAISSFKLALPPDFELYETAASSRGTNPVGMRRSLESKKTFQYVVIPRKSGDFQIPPISWSYFDPEKKAYQSISSNALSLSVSENNNSTQGANNNYLSPSDQNKENKIQDEFRYIKENISSSFPWGKLARILIALLLVLNLFFLLRIVKQKSSTWIKPLVKKDPFADARAKLSQLKKAPADDFLGDLEETILETIQAVLGTNPRGMTRGELEDCWKAAGLPYETFQKTSSFLDSLDQLRFSSSSKQEVLSARSKLFTNSEEIINLAARIKRK
jgi:hypothetical protein